MLNVFLILLYVIYNTITKLRNKTGSAYLSAHRTASMKIGHFSILIQDKLIQDYHGRECYLCIQLTFMEYKYSKQSILSFSFGWVFLQSCVSRFSHWQRTPWQLQRFICLQLMCWFQISTFPLHVRICDNILYLDEADFFQVFLCSIWLKNLYSFGTIPSLLWNLRMRITFQ